MFVEGDGWVDANGCLGGGKGGQGVHAGIECEDAELCSA